MKKINILIIEDNEGDVRLIKELLKDVLLFQSSVSSASTLTDGLDTVKNSNYDIILLDLSLPDSFGEQSFFSVHAHAADTPIVMITGTSDEELALKLITDGAQDYIVKSELSSGLLGKTIIHSIERNNLFRSIKSEKIQKESAFQRLEESEERFRKIFDEGPVGMVIASKDGTILHVNRAFCTMLGYTEDELKNLTYKDFTYPDDRIKSMDDARKLWEENQIDIHEEKRFLKKSGEIIWTSRTLTEIVSRDGTSAYVLAMIEDISDRKKAELSLKESEQRYKNLVDQSPDGIIIHTDGIIRFANPAAMKIIKANTIDELVGKTALQFVHPEYRQMAKERIIAALQSGTKVPEAIEKFVQMDGAVIDVEVNSIPIKYENKPSMQVVIKDITERVKIENELKETEKKFRTVVEEAAEIIFTTDVQGVFTYANPAAIRSSGYSLNELCSLNFLDLIVQSHKQRLLKNYLIQISNRVPMTTIEYPFYSKDGSVKWYNQNARMIVEQNEIKGFYIIARDITERKKTEEDLKLSEEKFRSLAEESPNMIFINKNGRIVYVNKRCVELLGYSKEEFLDPSFNFLKLIDAEYVDLVSNNFRAFYTGRHTISYEYALRTKEGKRIEASFNSTPILFEGVKSILGTVTDITERKKSEDAHTLSEKKYRSLFDNSPTAYLLMNPEGILSDVNVQWCKIMGYEREEVIGREIFEFVVEGEREDSRISFARMRKNKHHTLTNEIERSFVAKDGSVKICLARDYLTLDEHDTVISIQVSLVDITERKHIEDRLFENERLLRESQIISKIGSYTFDIPNGTWRASEALNVLFGINDTDDHSLQSWLALVHPDDRPMMAEYLNTNVLGNKERFDKEYRIVLPRSHDVRFVHGIGELEFDNDGNPVAMIGTIQDITERKRSEELQILFMTAFETVANGIVITNTDGNIIWANVAFTKMTGYTVEEIQGKNPKILKSGKQSQSQYKQMWDTILAGNVWKGELINKRKDGTLYVDEMTITPVRNEKNEITHFVAIKQDVTERNRTVEKIEEQAMLLNEAHEAILVRDMDFHIQFWNRGAEAMYGWKASEVMGKDSRKILLANNNNEYADFMANILEKGSHEGEFVHHTKDGKELLVNVRLTVIRDVQGNPKSIFSINSDVTEKRSVESQLLRAQRMESLGTLAGGIAHDLNNVLSPILMAVTELKKKNTDSRSQNFISALESSAKRGAGIVKQILMFARGAESKHSVIQCRHLIDEIIQVFKETFPKSITIVNDVPKNISTIEADPTQIHQLIMNLGVNARDAMPEGGTLTVSAENIVVDEQYARKNINAHTGRYVKISVIDTGEGMTEEVKDHLFEPFFTTKTTGKGTGLGLATVHTIVKNHNGFIEIVSSAGQGSRFDVYLPASGAKEVSDETEKSQDELLGNNELVLLVDDEDAIRQVMEQTLKISHYRVLTAPNGKEGLRLFSEHKDDIALVVTDMMMPVMDGRHLILAIKKMRPDLKIIASTGMVEKEQTESLDISYILMKPFAAEKLLAVIKNVLGQDNNTIAGE